jgi:hypothetical protein
VSSGITKNSARHVCLFCFKKCLYNHIITFAPRIKNDKEKYQSILG